MFCSVGVMVMIGLTVTVQVLLCVPLVAVMVAVPAPTAVTRPEELTVATASREEAQVVVLLGATFPTVSVLEEPPSRLMAVSLMPIARTEMVADA